MKSEKITAESDSIVGNVWFEKTSVYRQFPPVNLTDRTWINSHIKRAPIWCSVDLRDGNQALQNPMSIGQKLEMLDLLIEIGFKQIEIGFPAASQTDFDFARRIVGRGLPEDVTPQVLVQARRELIERTFEALTDVPRAIVHVYNSTSRVQRDVVFGKDRAAICDIAVNGVRWTREFAERSDIDVSLEYSPESFSATELDFACEICQRVIDEWKPTAEKPMIINLPATVEVASPDIYADQIEWMCRRLPKESVIVSVHPHNDRGEAVTAALFGVRAGARRIEGTLFGNGERTGNVCIITLAANMLTQGVPPELDFSATQKIVEVYESCTGMKVHPRHPYVGELVTTAFSGSHQDAIRKWIARRKQESRMVDKELHWNDPYRPFDERHFGRSFSFIRINSQSGKGGVAYVLESMFGVHVPKNMQPEMASLVQQVSDFTGTEVPPEEIGHIFEREYLGRNDQFSLLDYRSVRFKEGAAVTLALRVDGERIVVGAEGVGSIDATRNALIKAGCPAFEVVDFHEASQGTTSKAEALSFALVRIGERASWGAGRDEDIGTAGVKALLSGINRAFTGALDHRSPSMEITGEDAPASAAPEAQKRGRRDSRPPLAS